MKIDSGTALALTLVAIGMSMLQLPAQLIAMLWPWIMQLLAPVAIWAGLAWWLMPSERDH